MNRIPSGGLSSTSSLPPGMGTGLGVATPYPELDRCNQIYKMVCDSSIESSDPTGTVHPDVVGEKTAGNLYKELISQHPDWSPDQVDEALVKIIYDEDRRIQLKSIFTTVQDHILNLIERQSDSIFTHREKTQLKARIKKVQLQLPPPASIYSDEPDLFTKNEVYYERTAGGEMRLRVGGAYILIAKSKFNLIFTMAHELGHSIDPCELRESRLSLPAYDHLTACFLSHGLTATRKNRSECGENDQLSETFADWLATQITADLLNSFAMEFHGLPLFNAIRNSVVDLCEQTENQFEAESEYHPSPSTRIQEIFGRHPTIRRLLGCPSTPEDLTYCSFASDTNPFPFPVPNAK